MIGKLLRVLSVVAVGIAFSGVARAGEHESRDREKLVQSGTFKAHLTRVGFIVGVRWRMGSLPLTTANNINSTCWA